MAKKGEQVVDFHKWGDGVWREEPPVTQSRLTKGGNAEERAAARRGYVARLEEYKRAMTSWTGDGNPPTPPEKPWILRDEDL